MLNGSAMRALTDEHTDTQTHRQTGPILYPRPLTQEGMIQYPSGISIVTQQNRTVTKCHRITDFCQCSLLVPFTPTTVEQYVRIYDLNRKLGFDYNTSFFKMTDYFSVIV